MKMTEEVWAVWRVPVTTGVAPEDRVAGWDTDPSSYEDAVERLRTRTRERNVYWTFELRRCGEWWQVWREPCNASGHPMAGEVDREAGWCSPPMGHSEAKHRADVLQLGNLYWTFQVRAREEPVEDSEPHPGPGPKKSVWAWLREPF